MGLRKRTRGHETNARRGPGRTTACTRAPIPENLSADEDSERSSTPGSIPQSCAFAWTRSRPARGSRSSCASPGWATCSAGTASTRRPWPCCSASAPLGGGRRAGPPLGARSSAPARRELVFTDVERRSTSRLILAVAALRRRRRQPVVALLVVIPIVFAARSPTRDCARRSPSAVATTAGYVVLAVAQRHPGGHTLIVHRDAGLAPRSMCVWQARNHERRRELLAESPHAPIPLTGALNRRGFEHRRAPSSSRAWPAWAIPSSLALLDLDHFKQFNDGHGHAAGDELPVLGGRAHPPVPAAHRLAGAHGRRRVRRAAGRRRSCRRADRAAADQQRPLQPHSGRCVRGLASAPADGKTMDELYRRADAELYEAKPRPRAARSGQPPAGPRRSRLAPFSPRRARRHGRPAPGRPRRPWSG